MVMSNEGGSIFSQEWKHGWPLLYLNMSENYLDRYKKYSSSFLATNVNLNSSVVLE